MGAMKDIRFRALARQGGFVTPWAAGGMLAAFCVMVLALIAHDRWRAGWLLWLAGIAVFALFGVFIAGIMRFMGESSDGEPHLFRPARNDHYIAGPPAAVAKSLVPCVALAAYGAWALVAGAAWVLWPDFPFVHWFEGPECRLYATGCISVGAAGIFRFHVRWRWSHLAFGILVAIAISAFIAALVVWEAG